MKVNIVIVKFWIIFFFIKVGYVFSSIEETYNFSFEPAKTINNKNFIILEIPKDVDKVDVKYKNIKKPIFSIDYIAGSKSEMNQIKNLVYVRYNGNEAIVAHRNPQTSNYNCEIDEDGRFKRGACFRSAILILPPDLFVTIYQNDVPIYSRADLKEILNKYLPYLAKVPNSGDTGKSGCF